VTLDADEVERRRADAQSGGRQRRFGGLGHLAAVVVDHPAERLPRGERLAEVLAVQPIP